MEIYADVAQSVAHLLGKEEVGGSSPLVSSTLLKISAISSAGRAPDS